MRDDLLSPRDVSATVQNKSLKLTDSQNFGELLGNRTRVDNITRSNQFYKSSEQVR